MPRVAASLLLVLLAAGCSSGGPPAPPPTAEAPPGPPTTPRLATVRLERESPIRESSAVVLARIEGARRAIVADEDDGALIEIDLEKDEITSTTTVGARLRDLLVLADGRLAATLPDSAAVVTFTRDDKGTYHEASRARTATEPLAMALDPSDTSLYVSTGASHSLVILGAASLEPRKQFTLAREPRAVLVSGDGERVFVTHASETVVSVVPALGRTGEIETRDIGNRELCSGHGSCAGRRLARNAQAIARVADRGVVVPAAQSLPVPPRFVSKASCFGRRGSKVKLTSDGKPIGYGASDNEAGPPVINDFQTLDAATGAFFGVGMPALTARSCLLPRAAVAIGNDVLVACLGSAIVTRAKGKTFDFSAVKPERPMWRDGAFGTNVTVDSIEVPAGPTGIAVDRDGKEMVVWSSYARALTRIDAVSSRTVAKVELPRRVAREQAWLRGRELFFTNGDKRISADGRACGSCHVDGRDDGASWETGNGRRRTRLLSGEVAAGPYGWKGDSATLEDHVHRTLANLGGKGLPDDELSSLMVYVKSLPKLPSARTLDPEAEHGREIFAAADCGSCHAKGSSDRALHDVGTGGSFLTPTLAGVAMRGQLMHDGRFKDLEALVAGSPGMGRGTALGAEDRRALVHYLETL